MFEMHSSLLPMHVVMTDLLKPYPDGTSQTSPQSFIVQGMGYCYRYKSLVTVNS